MNELPEQIYSCLTEWPRGIVYDAVTGSGLVVMPLAWVLLAPVRLAVYAWAVLLLPKQAGLWWHRMKRRKSLDIACLVVFTELVIVQKLFRI